MADSDSTTPGTPVWELFLDDHVITRSTGFRRVLHHPEPRGIVIPADRPWDQGGLSVVYVGRRADGTFECYYQVRGSSDKEMSSGEFIAYAVSQDGVRWEKPILNLVKSPVGTETNLVPCGPPVDLGLHGNVSDPARRFVIALGDASRHCLRLYFGSELPDFINDPHWREKLVDSGGVKPSWKMALHFWDDMHQEWVSMRRSPNLPPARAVARWASKNLRDWTLEPVLYTDAADSTDPRYFDEAYGMLPVYTEGLVLGFVEWFTADHTRPDLIAAEQELIGRVYMKGTMELRVAVSRDGGLTWDRTVSREAWINHGTEETDYDRGIGLYCAPVRVGDEDWFYCSPVNGTHGVAGGYYHDRTPKHQGALYVQKHNRYVSLTAGTPQILITKPVKVTGKTLELNVDASHGEVTVGIGINRLIQLHDFPPAMLPNYMVRDREGKTHLEEGFRIEDCEPVRVDSIAHEVKFENADLASLRGKTVRLYIRVQDADLYGFRFK